MTGGEKDQGTVSGARGKPTESLRRQHKEILEVCDAIDVCLNAGPIKSVADDLSKLLAKLTGQLKVHLSMEDKVMYPRLMAHEDKSVSSLASKYQEEMGGLVGVYLGYADSYRTSAQIQEDEQGFAGATKKVFAALRTRIDREDNELYPLVDRIGL